MEQPCTGREQHCLPPLLPCSLLFLSRMVPLGYGVGNWDEKLGWEMGMEWEIGMGNWDRKWGWQMGMRWDRMELGGKWEVK